jgi:predicted nucleic acid-binding protein
MAELEFVDASVLAAAYDRLQPERRAAAALLLRHLWDKRSGVVSLAVLQDLHERLTLRAASPLPGESAAGILADTCCWQVQPLGTEDLLAAAALQAHRGGSLGQALALTAARKAGCRLLWSFEIAEERLDDQLEVISPLVG